MSEYANMVTMSAILVVLFWGGWHLPGVSDSPSIGWVILRFVIVWAKIILFLFFYMWIRWTLPRFRYDQLMDLAWLTLVPMGLLLLAWTAVLVLIGLHNTWLAPVGEIGIFLLLAAIGAVRARPITGRQRDLPMERVVQFE